MDEKCEHEYIAGWQIFIKLIVTTFIDKVIFFVQMFFFYENSMFFDFYTTEFEPKTGFVKGLIFWRFYF